MANNSKSGKTQNAVKARAVLFELETVAVNGRKTLYDTVRRALKDEKSDLTPVDYSRYFMDRPLAEGLERYVGARELNVPVAQLSKRIDADIAAWASGGRLKLNPALSAWLERRQPSQVRMGALCGLGGSVTEALSAALGLKDKSDDCLFLAMEGGRSPTADAWLKLAKQLKVIPPLCVVLASGMKSVKSAIAAGMHCVAIEDSFNAFQDFSGADYIVDELDADILDKALELMQRH